MRLDVWLSYQLMMPRSHGLVCWRHLFKTASRECSVKYKTQNYVCHVICFLENNLPMDCSPPPQKLPFSKKKQTTKPFTFSDPFSSLILFMQSLKTRDISMLFVFPRNVQPTGSNTEINQMWQFSCLSINKHGLSLMSDLKQERFYLGQIAITQSQI